MQLRWTLLSLIWLALCACAPLSPGPAQPRGAGPLVAVYLVAHDGHTGIAMRRTDIPGGLWPESRDFPQPEYLEIGWGNRDYYYGRNQGVWGTLNALRASPSVLHVAGFSGPPAGYFRANEIVELAIPVDGIERLVRYIHDAFERTDAQPAPPLGPGLYGESRFYPGWESFHLFRTCNVWTARALRIAGLPIRDSITMEGLIAQARGIGKSVNRPKRCTEPDCHPVSY